MSKPPAIADIVAGVTSGQQTAESVVAAALAAAHADTSHSLLEIFDDALEQAKAIDTRIAAGEDVGPLAGVPYVAKDNFLTIAGHSTAASKILEPFQAPYEGTVIKKLTEAGAILIGKANLDSFGHGSSTENSDFGPTKNPHDETRVPGGSSGGSAAAVALSIVPFALGTDTGGSLRLPASFCGVIGYKPTYGLVSRYGVVAMASSTDCIGPLANSIEDVAQVLEVISGQDRRDGTTIERDSQPYLPEDATLNGKKFGVIKQFMEAGLDDNVRQAIEKATEAIRQAGGEVHEIDLPSLDLALAAYYIIVPAEISSNLGRYDGVRYGLSADAADLDANYKQTRSTGFNRENKRRIMIGTFVTSSGYHDAYYLKAQTVRSKLIAEVTSAFVGVDFMLGPLAATTAFELGAKNTDPLAMYLTDVMTVAANLLGTPSLSLPLSVAGMPIGLQVLAPQKHDRELLTITKALEAIV